MRQLLCLTMLLSCASVLYAQDRKGSPKVAIGFHFSPDYSYRSLQRSKGGNVPDFIISSRNDLEKAKMGYTTGLDVLFQLSKIVGLETGLEFSNKGYQIKSRKLTYESPSASTDPVTAGLKYTYQYLGIPVRISFSFGNGRTSFVTGAGLVTSFLLNANTTAVYEYQNGTSKKNRQTYTDDFRKIDLSPMLSLGVKYKLSDKLYLKAEPTFRYGLLNTRSAPITEHLWSAGLNVGFYSNLK